MSFVQREIDKIRALLIEQKHPKHDELYAAQQALEWALEPDGIASPFTMIAGKRDDVLHFDRDQVFPDDMPKIAS